MPDDAPRAEDLMMLSSGARRLIDVVAAAGAPVRFEVLRHLLRVSEETMIAVLEEAVAVRLVRRGDDPATYVSYSDAARDEIVLALGEERRDRMRAQIASAAQRVFE